MLNRYVILLLSLGILRGWPVSADLIAKDTADPLALAEERRIEVIQRVSPSVVCVFDESKRGGGSGVIISPDGYGLTNYHVVAGMLETRRGFGGLGDGVLYEMEILGIDPTGDVAMFKLKGPGRLPFSALGDSDAVQLGDAVMAMGNPFVMSEDYSPTVTMGIVTGVHRYQWGVGGNLTYSDCIQTDASINPGNSGGPLFNMAGEVVGINGRISVNTRGRYNVGFGYAISANQVRRFLPALRAGRLARHGTLLATVEADAAGNLLFQEIGAESPLHTAGVNVGDRIVSFDGVDLHSPNHLVSVLGAYPEDWPAVLEVERGGERSTKVVRLAPVIPKLKSEYAVPEEIVKRETQRVLQQFRAEVLGKGDGAGSARRWTVTREFLDGSENARQTYAAEHRPGEVIRYTRKYDDGRDGAIIEVRAEEAVRREAADAEAAPLPAEMQMVQLALFALQDRFIHAETLATIPAGLTTTDSPALRGDVAARTDTPSWEVIESSIGGHVVARYSFDPGTGRCMRFRVKDVPSGAEATIELFNHRDVGGLTWPTAMEVIARNFRYRDTLSDWGPAS